MNQKYWSPAYYFKREINKYSKVSSKNGFTYIIQNNMLTELMLAPRSSIAIKNNS